MMYRKFSLFSVLVIVSLLLAACSSAVSTQAPVGVETAVSTESSSSTEVATEAAAVSGSAACPGAGPQTVVDLKCREITVGVENAYLPFNYVLVSTGQPAGWDYDTWKEICNRLNCVPVMTEAAWDGLIQGTSNGQYDVAADGITITDDRAKVVDFSDGYLSIEQRLIVRKGETRFTDMASFVKMDGLVMGTQANTTNYETAKNNLPETRLKAFDQMPFAIQALINGDVDAVIIDQVAGMGYMGENSDKIEFVGDPIVSDQLGFAFPKGSDLLAPVNQALAAMKADGSLDKINLQYFGPDFKVTGSDVK